jgi:WD40 repeat protein
MNDYFSRLEALIANWAAEIELHTRSGSTDKCKYSEYISANLLNAAFSLNLKGLGKNHPAVDLGDKNAGVAFQITARTDNDKIRENLHTFADKNLICEYPNGMRFLLLVNHKPDWKKETKDSFNCIVEVFDTDRHIFTFPDIIEELKQNYLDNSKTFQELLAMMEWQFGNKTGEPPEELFRQMLIEGSRDYYEGLRGENGWFGMLHIEDNILTHPKSSDNDKEKWIPQPVTIEKDKDDTVSDETVITMLPRLWNRACKHVVIVGEGGMGKTVSLVRLRETFLNNIENGIDDPIPVFIALNEYNHHKANVCDFIQNQVLRNYLGDIVGNLKNVLLKFFKTPLKETNGGKIPAVVLFLDGFNEITTDRRELLLELKFLLEHGKGLQVVMTSRYDMRGNFNWGNWNLAQLQPLEDNNVESYLKGRRMILPAQKPLKMLIRNPMMLTLYAASCEDREKYKVSSYFRFKKRVESTGELLFNFMEAQVARLWERETLDEGKLVYYRFLLWHLLPALGFEMEKAGLFDFTREQVQEYLHKWLLRFGEEDFLDAFPGFGENVSALPVGECKHGQSWRERAKEVREVFCKEIHMLVDEGESYRFLHQNFRDFFAAVHVLNEIEMGLKSNLIPSALKERAFEIYIRRMMGEIEGEHYAKPYLIDGEGWKINIDKTNRLHRMVDSLRGKFGEEVGYAVWNIVEIWKTVRGELSGADLSRLDLSKIGFNGIRCSRFYKGTYLYTTFDHSLIHERNFFPNGHHGDVCSAVYSPDRDKILSGSDDGTIKLWNIATGECIRTFKGHSGCVNSVIYSACGKNFFSASTDKTIKEWDVETGRCIRTYFGHSEGINSVVYSPEREKILSASDDETIMEWDVEGGKCPKTYSGQSGQVYSAVYKPGGSKILSTSSYKIIKEWDLETGKCFNLDGDSYMLSLAIYTRKANSIIAGAESGAIFEIDVKTGFILKEFVGHSKIVSSLAYSPCGNKILSASWDNTIKEWDADTGICLKTFIGHINWVNSALYSQDGKRIISTSCDRTLKEWDVETGDCIKTFHGYSNTVFIGPQFSMDGEKILSCLVDGTIIEWSTVTGKCIQIFKGHADLIGSLAYSPDGERILSLSIGEPIKEWDVASGKCIRIYDVKTSKPNKAIYSPDGKVILADFVDHTLREWSVENGVLLKKYPYPSFMADGAYITDHLKYSADGKKILALYNSRVIKEWERDTGRCLSTYKLDDFERYWIVEYGPGSQEIILISEKKIQLIDSMTGRRSETPVKNWQNFDKRNFSPCGKMLVKIENDRIMIVNAETGNLIKSIQNISGLLIQNSTFRKLHPDSVLSEESKKLMMQYGGIFERHNNE